MLNSANITTIVWIINKLHPLTTGTQNAVSIFIDMQEVDNWIYLLIPDSPKFIKWFIRQVNC